MAAQIIDGKKVSQQIKDQLKEEIRELKEKHGLTPGLAVVLVGEDPASTVYVRNKGKSSQEVGILSRQFNLAATSSQQEVLDLVHQLNGDRSIHGILVQLPLPDHIQEDAIIQDINPIKDVDGFHPTNVGNMLLGNPSYLPCTPAGIMVLLDSIGLEIKGKHAVVVGRSNIVGKPVSFLLLQRHATLTICHSRTADLSYHTRQADILVAAIGKAKMIKGSMVKEGAVVIDVGVNRLEGGLVGDVDYEEASKVASYITPVPGGVGPMTIAMLLKNAVLACKRQHGLA
ncbi:MAG: bifunctional methylenetetrahydrofolate dehydrogenase/methenyltetrahydrofolate cyclohydrolase FolD [candidate division NC10 bacterium]|nr:bifunctional methylenetetrahydrofolate dehydrogenase/methenyltetrahydrofolate cyclohydrolase FolD [candidate division NC10 bacterium]